MFKKIKLWLCRRGLHNFPIDDNPFVIVLGQPLDVACLWCGKTIDQINFDKRMRELGEDGY